MWSDWSHFHVNICFNAWNKLGSWLKIKRILAGILCIWSIPVLQIFGFTSYRIGTFFQNCKSIKLLRQCSTTCCIKYFTSQDDDHNFVSFEWINKQANKRCIDKVVLLMWRQQYSFEHSKQTKNDTTHIKLVMFSTFFHWTTSICADFGDLWRTIEDNMRS